MDSSFIELVSKLPHKDMTQKEIQKIKRILPIPSDHRVLWIDVLSKGGYPAAYAITDKAFIYKASKSDVKEINQKIKGENKGKTRKEKRKNLKYIYQIIPWDLYSPEIITLKLEKHTDDSETISFTFDGERIVNTGDRVLYDFFSSYNSMINEKRKIIQASTMADLNSFAVRNIYMNQDLGVANSQTGHGIYAELENNSIDRFNGKKVGYPGPNNAPNGPDRIVNGQQIQTKYYNTAKGSVDACFDKKTGNFRYMDHNNIPMQIEVPSDQYHEAINRFEDKIRKGKVPGITDPNQAKKIIRKGNISYRQARNIAKAGTVESIKFDMRTNAVHCASALGISAVASFAFTLWRTKSFEYAAENAIKTGIQVFGTSFTSSVLASQLSRSGVPKVLSPAVELLSKVIGTERTQGVINSIRSLAGKKAIYGAAAQKNFVKYLSTELVTGTVMFAVFSVPDTYRVVTKKVSGAQYVKNLFALASSLAGAAVGSAVGARIGGKVGKFAGPIGYVGGVAGGMLFGSIARIIGNIFREDDMTIYGRMINEYVSISMIDSMMTDEEQNEFIKFLNKDEKGIKKLTQKLVKSQNQERDILDFLAPKIKKATSKRQKINIEQESIVKNGLKSYFEGEEDAA